MNGIEDLRNKIICGDALEVLKRMPDECVDMVITRPPYYCYAENHEVLTKKGWRPIKNIKIGDMVFSTNPSNMEIGWVRVTQATRWNYQGKMISFKNTHIDLLVTPNHKMLVYQKKPFQPIKPRSLSGYFKNTSHLVGKFLVEAKNIKRGYITPKTGFKWKGQTKTHFFLYPIL